MSHQPKLRHLRAHLWLLFILCALGCANYLFFLFSFHEHNPFPLTRGLTFASSLWSAALLVAMLLRRSWARYVLIALLVLSMLGFGLAALMMHSRSLIPLAEPTQAVVIGLALYAVALTPLGASRSLRRYLAPRTAGGQ